MESHDDGDMPPPLMDMFINSTDTLQGRAIDQTMPPTWNDRPPLFVVRNDGRRRGTSTEEEPLLLKGMVREGIPPPLRCALWLSNAIQSSNPQQQLKDSHSYRTLAKVRALDYAYSALWEGENAPLNPKNKAKTIGDGEKVDPDGWATFGNSTFLSKIDKYPHEGQLALQRVLYALDFILGIEYSPMIPALVTYFLNFMSPSYAFAAIREMAHHASWYFPCSRAEYVAFGRTFMDILEKLHPQTADDLEHLGITERFTDAIFQEIFSTILSREHVYRIIDIFTLEGMKSLFRFGIALVVMFNRDWKADHSPKSSSSSTSPERRVACSPSDADEWWEDFSTWAHSRQFNFELVVKKAYGVHGHGIRKRFRFPRRPILTRFIRFEEQNYIREQQESGVGAGEELSALIRPLGLTVRQDEDAENAAFDKEPVTAVLADPAWVRGKLAEWLPLSLRLTKMELIYSTNSHGRTLEQLYQHCERTKHTLLLAEPLDAPDYQAVGMYAPHTWEQSTKVYGDGSCFLFRLNKLDPEKSACWKWHPKRKQDVHDALEEEGDDYNNETALLEQFQVGTREYISMGGNPNGSAGLRLNEDLTKGESSSAVGFDNVPLVDGTTVFEVGLVEIYQLVRQIDGVPIH